MSVPEATIAQVVSEASQRMEDPQYISGQVDQLMRTQPAITQYVIAHQDELSVESIVTVLFHAALIARSIADHVGRAASQVGYPDLDAAATTTPTLEVLAKDEPNLASYIVSNVDLPGGEAVNRVAGKLLAHIARGLLVK